MGTWSSEIFGNDESFHWLSLLENTDDYSLVRQSLEEILAAGENYVEIDLASGALAAAEVVAQAFGYPSASAAADRIGEWLEFDCHEELPSDLVRKAQLATERVLRPPCEMLEGWQSPADLGEWCRHVRELQTRLRLATA